MKCNAIDCNTVKKAYNSPELVELDISKTAADKKSANHKEGIHSPSDKVHQAGRFTS